jgi:hypothetical protein
LRFASQGFLFFLSLFSSRRAFDAKRAVVQRRLKLKRLSRRGVSRFVLLAQLGSQNRRVLRRDANPILIAANPNDRYHDPAADANRLAFSSRQHQHTHSFNLRGQSLALFDASRRLFALQRFSIHRKENVKTSRKTEKISFFLRRLAFFQISAGDSAVSRAMGELSSVVCRYRSPRGP